MRHAASACVKRWRRLGPIFVKFGQVLSTRRDLMPLDIADELATPARPGAALSGRCGGGHHRARLAQAR